MKVIIFLAMLLMSFPANKISDTIYDFTVQDIDGKNVGLEGYKGKVIMIVNVASKCGYTPQYEGLQAVI